MMQFYNLRIYVIVLTYQVAAVVSKIIYLSCVTGNVVYFGPFGGEVA